MTFIRAELFESYTGLYMTSTAKYSSGRVKTTSETTNLFVAPPKPVITLHLLMSGTLTVVISSFALKIDYHHLALHSN